MGYIHRVRISRLGRILKFLEQDTELEYQYCRLLWLKWPVWKKFCKFKPGNALHAISTSYKWTFKSFVYLFKVVEQKYMNLSADVFFKFSPKIGETWFIVF